MTWSRHPSFGCIACRIRRWASRFVILDGKTLFGSGTPDGQLIRPFLLLRRVGRSALIVKMALLSVSIPAFPGQNQMPVRGTEYVNLPSIDLNTSDAFLLSWSPFPHSASFSFQNWALSTLLIHVLSEGHCVALLSGFTSTSMASAKLTVHQFDKTAFVSLDILSSLAAASDGLASNFSMYSKRSLGPRWVVDAE